jgi:hypothetical protein
MNTNAAKLTPAQIQQGRDLHRLGFRSATIATAFNVCARTMSDVNCNRAWTSLPDVPGELPLLDIEAALTLRLRTMRSLVLPPVLKYAGELATHLGVQVSLLLLAWTRKSDELPAANVACDVPTDRGFSGGRDPQKLAG